jgi:hypothetical protein
LKSQDLKKKFFIYTRRTKGSQTYPLHHSEGLKEKKEKSTTVIRKKLFTFVNLWELLFDQVKSLVVVCRFLAKPVGRMGGCFTVGHL